MSIGACRDLPEDQKRLFYGKQGYAQAKKICNTLCGMREECLENARIFEQNEPERFGIWGGTSANERDKMFGYRRPEVEAAA